jgi:hypothetical protein
MPENGDEHTVSFITRISADAKRAPSRVIRPSTTLPISGSIVVAVPPIAADALDGPLDRAIESRGSGFDFVVFDVEVFAVDAGGGREGDEVTGPAIEA